MTKRGWLLFVAMGLIWGVPYLFIKVAVDELTPATLVLARTALSAALLLPLAAARGHLRELLPHWRPLVAFAVVEMAVPWWLLADAETQLSSSLTGLLIAGVPLVGALLGWATGADRLDGRRLAGLVVGLAGVAALAGLDVGAANWVALLEIAGVAAGYALGPFILARHLSQAPGLGVISVSLTLSALVYLPAGLVQMPDHRPSGKVVVAVLVLALLCTAVAFLIFFALIEEIGPVRATVITYVNPAVAVLLGVLFLDEPLTWGIGIGSALILTGSVLATQRSREPRPAPEGELASR